MIALTSRLPKLAEMFCAVVSLALLPGYLTGAESVFAAEIPQPFAAFKADVDLDIEDGEFEVMATFTLGAGSNGLDLTKEAVGLRLTGGTAAVSIIIPAGSFKKDRSGRFAFQGTINRVRLEASISPLRGGGFEFQAEGERADLKGVANPVTLSLTIGDDGDSRAVSAKIE